jgi:ABC-2 type transport system permease protein
MSLLIAETRKLTTVWTTAIITAVGLVLLTVGAAFLVFESEFSGEFLGTDPQIADVLDQIGAMNVIALIVGLLSVTTEFRHETIGRTLQLTPSRTRVVATKMLVGAGYGLVFFLLGLVPIALLLLVSGAELELGAATTRALWQGPVGLVLMAVFGVAIGALLRSQVVAVALTLIYVFVVESLFVQFLPAVGRWLPLQALNAMFVPEEMLANQPGGAMQPLDPTVGLVVFLVYCTLAAAAAIMLMRVRDV